MRIEQDWIREKATQDVCRALTAEGAQVLFVGGCVRNALMGEPVSDMDIATDAHPETVLALAKKAGIKAIPTGIDHGTVTLVMHGIPYEITTFRKDVETDGRRAVVAFADNIADDAARRDFTMNAIYARPDGTVVDPLKGLPDLHARRLRFIGDAEQRIREDYLRTLRYFRFHAWYGNQAEGFDPEALAAIAATLDGLDTLSRERVGAEFVKLLSAPDPAPAVATMRQIGVLSHVLPGADDRALGPLVHLEGSTKPDATRRLAALGGAHLQKALRLSKSATTRVAQLREETGSSTSAAELAYRQGAAFAHDVVLLRSAVLEMPLAPDYESEISGAAASVFPLTAKDLMPTYRGPALGKRLRKLEKTWISSGFTLSRAALLALPDDDTE
jgi:poly(A) polymerase